MFLFWTFQSKEHSLDSFCLINMPEMGVHSPNNQQSALKKC